MAMAVSGIIPGIPEMTVGIIVMIAGTIVTTEEMIDGMTGGMIGGVTGMTGGMTGGITGMTGGMIGGITGMTVATNIK